MSHIAKKDIRANRKRILGIDLGIASCGWALIEVWDQDKDQPSGCIVGMGTWMFDAPETDKERTPTNQIRRLHRGQRRVIRRRRQRMNQIRTLLGKNALLPNDNKDALKTLNLNPWEARANALERKLTPAELAVALRHIARHRGFKSNKKSDGGSNAADDSSRMLKAIEATKERLQQYRTVGELFAKDPELQNRKRNRDKDYSRSVLRTDLEHEVAEIFKSQRRLGNAAASENLEREFITTAFFQRPLQDSEELLGLCPFEREEKRTSKRAPSFELFRFVSRLNTLRIREGRTERALTPEEIAATVKGFGKQKAFTYKTLRKLANLTDEARIVGIGEKDERHDIASRTDGAAYGTATLHDVLGDAAWESLIKKPAILDRIAEIITFRDAPDRIRIGLTDLELEPLILDILMSAVDKAVFAKFTGAGHISSKAARAINHHLLRGLVYSAACEAAGYDHTAKPDINLQDIGSPVARKALSEAIKQVNAIVREWGVPDSIHVELARDIGKSAEERDKIKSGIDDRNAEKERLRVQFKDDVGRECRTAEDLIRYELWKQQQGRCIYTDDEIHPNWIGSTDNRAQVDHILPWSRFGDDSFHNKILCLAKANQDKKGRTPFEWFDKDKTQADWDAFVARVETNKSFRGFKKRNLLLKNAKEIEERFRSRNLNDTRYAARALAEFLAKKYPAEAGTRRVFARPGSLTSKLRQAWGVQDLKKDKDTGKRIADDRHHALDALVCAATTEAMLSWLTRAFQEAERRGAAREFIRMPPPWPNFVEDAKARHGTVFVARAERRRARGKAHDATIKQSRREEGKLIIYERKLVQKLTINDLNNVKDPDRNQALIESLRKWIESGKPKETAPLSPKGDHIKKVRLRTKDKEGVEVREGIVDRGEMTRVDVFARKNRKGTIQYFLVPIYPHQIANKTAWPKPPMRAVSAYKLENEWEEITDDDEFLFSLFPMSLIEIVKSDGQLHLGYFRGLHRGTGAVSLSAHKSKNEMTEGIGARTLAQFKKLSVDRLGNRHSINRELRTWHGAACI